MSAIDYPRHFVYLAIAAVVLTLVQSLSFPTWPDRFTFLFALVGMLHASALVIALRVGPCWRRVIFVVTTAALSACVPYIGMAGPHALGLGRFALIASFAIGSAVGALAYWLLVRAFWLPRMEAHDCVRAVALCVGATALALIFVSVLGQESAVRDVLPTILWWYAFSYALWTSRSPSAAAKNRWRGP